MESVRTKLRTPPGHKSVILSIFALYFCADNFFAQINPKLELHSHVRVVAHAYENAVSEKSAWIFERNPLPNKVRNPMNFRYLHREQASLPEGLRLCPLTTRHQTGLHPTLAP
jgi:hypothetical protein